MDSHAFLTRTPPLSCTPGFFLLFILRQGLKFSLYSLWTKQALNLESIPLPQLPEQLELQAWTIRYGIFLKGKI